MVKVIPETLRAH